MKVLHIIPYTIFIVNYINAFSKEKEGEENFFYVYGSHVGQEDRNIEVSNPNNVIFAEKIEKEDFESRYYESDIWVMQCIPEDILICEMLYNCYQDKKIPLVIVPWGRELFKKSDIYMSKDFENIGKIDEYKKYFIEHCTYVITSKYAFEYIQANYNVHCKSKYFNLLNTFSIEECFNLIESNETKNNELGIMIGHRGTSTSRHIEVFEKLHLLFGKTVRIICPLVYGNPQYIERVICKGKEFFGEKMICLTSWQEKREYYRWLNENVDVAIFNNDSSEGANTVFYLIYAGKKVYINKNNEVYWILRELGVVFEEYSQNILREEIEKPLNIEQKKKNRNIMEKFGSEEEFRSSWSELYIEILNNKRRTNI